MFEQRLEIEPVIMDRGLLTDYLLPQLMRSLFIAPKKERRA
jgi:hypothetical protein